MAIYAEIHKFLMVYYTAYISEHACVLSSVHQHNKTNCMVMNFS